MDTSLLSYPATLFRNLDNQSPCTVIFRPFGAPLDTGSPFDRPYVVRHADDTFCLCAQPLCGARVVGRYVGICRRL